jgi:2-keto-4-pentenoate hydratase/2-oxohepta-3-ene-1,7-dioic acid hydratase in catechol pathway
LWFGVSLRVPRTVGKFADFFRSDLIFSISKIVSFCSQGTTLKPGSIILTGTPAGVGHSFSPKEYLRAGDEFSVEILPHIGTLTTIFANEK